MWEQSGLAAAAGAEPCLASCQRAPQEPSSRVDADSSGCLLSNHSLLSRWVLSNAAVLVLGGAATLQQPQTRMTLQEPFVRLVAEQWQRQQPTP
jgi:hypothetical protein